MSILVLVGWLFDHLLPAQDPAEQVYGTVHEWQAKVQWDEQTAEDFLYQGVEEFYWVKNGETAPVWAGEKLKWDRNIDFCKRDIFLPFLRD